jgi:hypothetical protein
MDYSTPEALEFVERSTGCFEPTADLLRQTIDAVFWASLSKEEGKPALARVRFADIREPYCQLEPRAVSTDSLRKLSPLLDEPSNALLVRKDANIVGVGKWRDGNVRIVAHRPGHLAVLDDSVVLGVFDKGEWVIVSGSSVNATQILNQTLTGNEFKERFSKARMVLGLAMQARRTGRGATFVMVPSDRQDGIGEISYPISNFPALPGALEAWRRANAATPPLAEQEENRRLVRNALTITAAGAGIDGATLIDESNLRLVGFGAKINARDDNFDIRRIEVPSGDIQVIKKEHTGGMRHQTAARLVQQNHSATVITVSQDGPVSLFAWAKQYESVVMFKHLDRYLEAEAAEFER